MPTAWMQDLWQGEKDRIIFACIHCGERSEAGAKPFPRGLCDSCKTTALRRETHEENEKVMPGWLCGFCQKTAAKLAVT